MKLTRKGERKIRGMWSKKATEMQAASCQAEYAGVGRRGGIWLQHQVSTILLTVSVFWHAKNKTRTRRYPQQKVLLSFWRGSALRTGEFAAERVLEFKMAVAGSREPLCVGNSSATPSRARGTCICRWRASLAAMMILQLSKIEESKLHSSSFQKIPN